jgi:deoxyribonuclease IV
MANIRFGPGGLGPAKEATGNLVDFSKKGINACEVEFVYSVYLKEEEAKKIGKVAKDLGIVLSIHAPYYINLNSGEDEKIESSKTRIIKCCEIGHHLGARKIVFHSGFFGKKSYEESYERIKNAIIEIQEVVKENKWDVELCPETMGKVNVFGSIEDIKKLSEDTGCSFCIDFAHILARYKEDRFEEVTKAFPQKSWHCHFSGIEYGDKGEKRHLVTEEKDLKDLLLKLRNLDKDIVIINESPECVKDSVKGLKIWERLKDENKKN